MMDQKEVVISFKNKYVKAGFVLDLSLLPILFQELIKAGLNLSHITNVFYEDLSCLIFDDESKEVQVYAKDALMFLGRSLPKGLEKKEEKAVVSVKIDEPTTSLNGATAAFENGIIKTDHLAYGIPKEEDEGDPFYTAPEQRIALKPEDFKPMAYDWNWLSKLGIKRSTDE